MGTSVFLSYPKPFTQAQGEFVEQVSHYLRERGLDPRTLGVTDYDTDVPLKAIRRLMMESNGLIAIAFRRLRIAEGQVKPGTADAYAVDDCWLTSPWSHIEPAMAFQLGLPVLILREAGVIADGVLEKGVIGSYMPEFDLAHSSAYLDSSEGYQILNKWAHQVAAVVDSKGMPPKLF